MKLPEDTRRIYKAFFRDIWKIRSPKHIFVMFSIGMYLFVGIPFLYVSFYIVEQLMFLVVMIMSCIFKGLKW